MDVAWFGVLEKLKLVTMTYLFTVVNQINLAGQAAISNYSGQLDDCRQDSHDVIVNMPRPQRTFMV